MIRAPVPVGNLMRAVIENLEEVRMTMEERLREWPQQFLREGREQGLEQGIEQGREQGIEQGREQGREQGIEQGREQGLEQGRERERELLRHMATQRFGDETGERLAALLTDITEADHFTEAGDCLLRCEDGDEFLSRVALIARSR